MVYNGGGTGKCTTCGGGLKNRLHVYNPLACRAPSRQCDSYSYMGTIGRGLVHNCTSPGSCCPGVVVSDSEPLPGPDVDHEYCHFQVGICVWLSSAVFHVVANRAGSLTPVC